MLTLTVGRGRSVIIGGNIKITVVGVEGQNVRIGFEAPREIPIIRENAVNKEPPANTHDRTKLVSIGVGVDGLCVCGKDSFCPLGKRQDQECCSREELLAAGVSVHPVGACNGLLPVDDDYRDCHGGHTSGGV